MNFTKEQNDAINLSGKNIIVSAGAGSGKTAVLTERVIKKLKDGINIDELLILTFTNAAAFEMKDRIRKSIKENNILIEYSIMDNICTFDSWIMNLIKKYHYLLGIDASIDIIDKNVLAYELRRILDKIFAEFYSSQNENFLEMIKTYSIKDDKNIKDMIIKYYIDMSPIINKDEFLDSYMNKYFSDEFITNKISEYVSLLSERKILIKSIIKEWHKGINDKEIINYYSKLNDSLDDLYNATSYNDYKNLNISLPTRKFSKNINLEEKQRLIFETDKIKKILEDITSLCEYDLIEEIKESIDLIKPHVNIIVTIIKRLKDSIMEYKALNNTYEFGDLADYAVKLFKGNRGVVEEIRSSYKEIMIDEYQDTNDLQEYLISLISNNNVYMVGDIKQSIYLFRNANPKVFLNKYNSYKEDKNGIKIDLFANFRSREPVLLGINKIFSGLMSEDVGGAYYNDGHALVYGNHLYDGDNRDYNIEIINYNHNKLHKKSEEEAFLIGRDIISKVEHHYKVIDKDTKKIRDIAYSDFAVLMFSKTNFEVFNKVFEYLKIPLSATDSEKFIYSDEIYTIKNILKLILCFRDFEYYKDNFRHAFLSVTRSFVCNYEDNDIAAFIIKKDSNLIELMARETSIFNEMYQKLNLLSKESKYLPIYSLLEKIYDYFEIEKNIIRLGNYEFISTKLEFLIEKCHHLANLGYNLKMLIEYFDNIVVNEEDIEFNLSHNTRSNSVKMMTIHKSKGLEFSVCYYPDMYKLFPTIDEKNKYLFKRDYGFIIPYYRDGLGNTILKTLSNERSHKEDISERLRILYVALTRAKEKMIILVDDIFECESCTKDDNGMVLDIEKINFKSFKDCLSSIKEILSEDIVDIGSVDVENYDFIKNKNYEKLINDSDDVIEYKVIDMKKEERLNFTFSKSLDDYTALKYKNVSLGNYVHSILEHIDFTSDIAEELSSIELDERFKKNILNLFSSSIMKNIKNAKIFKEYEFSYEYDGQNYSGVIDLILEYDDEIIIVDYKLKSIDDEAYEKQLKGYKKFVSSKTPKEVRTYLYSIIDGITKEVKV